MALKAGYNGIKKSFLDKLSALLTAKVIESIGNGLSLSEQGELTADIDTETMEFKEGKLSALVDNIVISTDEFDTGVKWVDGNNIYGKCYIKSISTTNTGNTGTDITFESLPDISVLVDAVIWREKSDTRVQAAVHPYIQLKDSTTLTLYMFAGATAFSGIVIFYTKASENVLVN